MALITKEEFLSALEIVNAYRRQVTEQFEEMREELKIKDFSLLALNEDTLMSDTGLSTRARNALWCYALNHIPEVKGLDWTWNKCEVTIGHFKNIKKSELVKFRNFGKKSLTEIEKVLFEAGIVI